MDIELECSEDWRVVIGNFDGSGARRTFRTVAHSTFKRCMSGVVMEVIEGGTNQKAL